MRFCKQFADEANLVRAAVLPGRGWWDGKRRRSIRSEQQLEGGGG